MENRADRPFKGDRFTTSNPIERFWYYVDKRGEDECWEWKGHKSPEGYGHLHIKTGTTVTSRISWQIHYGEIPKGMLVCHKCDNPPCCNPKHLFLGTDLDNIQDRDKKKRNKQCKGRNHYKAEIVEADVINIRNLNKEGMSQKELSKMYNLSQASISKILLRQGWKSVE